MTTIVAEIGVEHCGRMEDAVKLAQLARNVGADFVKFQMFYNFVCLRQFEFTENQWKSIFSLLNYSGIPWFCTPFDEQAVRFLAACEMKMWKIPSNPAVIHNGDLLRSIARVQSNEQTIISTGISDDTDIEQLLKIFKFNNPTLLYCVSKYPCKVSEINFQRMEELKKFGVPVGFSDHTTSYNVPVLAVRCGATIIEKHITLSREHGGPDACVSLEPDEFGEMVGLIRRGV